MSDNILLSEDQLVFLATNYARNGAKTEQEMIKFIDLCQEAYLTGILINMALEGKINIDMDLQTDGKFALVYLAKETKPNGE
jgi:hypothetical protein